MKSVWMRILGVLLIVLGVIFTLMAVMLFIGSENDKKAQSIIFLAISAPFWTFGIRIMISKRSIKKLNKFQKQEQMNVYYVRHQTGLPLAPGTACTIAFNKNDINIEGSNTSYHLELSKVRDIFTRTDREIQQEYVSSAGGALAGAMMFGGLGAMIGGRAKKRTVSSKEEHYLIITYQKENLEMYYVSFLVFDMDVKQIDKQAEELRKCLAQNLPNQVDL